MFRPVYHVSYATRMHQITEAITKPLTGFGHAPGAIPVRLYEDTGFALRDLLSGDNRRPKAPGLNH
jgi:hypothetical protein